MQMVPSPLTCEQIGASNLHLKVEVIVDGVDGLILQQPSQAQLPTPGYLLMGPQGTVMPLSPAQGSSRSHDNDTISPVHGLPSILHFYQPGEGAFNEWSIAHWAAGGPWPCIK